MKSADSDVIFKDLISACHQATANSLVAYSLLGRCKRTFCRFQRSQIVQDTCHSWAHMFEFTICSSVINRKFRLP